MPFEMFLRSVRQKIFEGFAVWEGVREVYGVKPIGQPKVLSLWGWGGAISSDPHVSLPIGGGRRSISFGFHHFPQALLIGNVLLWAEC